MNDCEFTLSITALANTIAKKIDDVDTLDILSNSFMLLGDTLSVISARRTARTLQDNSASSQTGQGDSEQTGMDSDKPLSDHS